MMNLRQLLFLPLASLLFLPLQGAIDEMPTVADSTMTYELDEVRVLIHRPLLRQAGLLMSTPGAMSLVTPTMLHEYDIKHLSDLTAVVPNLYMPDYGSRLTSPIYMRGIGTRSGGQSTAFFIDGVPVLNSSINRYLLGIESVEVMSGALSNIYGRNAMAGTILLTSRSPIDDPALDVRARAGNHGIVEGAARLAHAFNSKVGLALGGYYNRNNGFYTNAFDGTPADAEEAYGANMHFEWRPDASQRLRLAGVWDGVRQGAFPYAMINPKSGETMPINYNAPGSYDRTIGEARLAYDKSWDEARLDFTASYQALRDNMMMDQDYTPRDIFTINQKQRQDAVTADLTLRNKEQMTYNWTLGLNGIYQMNHLEVPVAIRPEGLMAMIQPGLNKANKNDKVPVQMMVDASKERVNHNLFDKSSYGVALYHESNLHEPFGWTGFDLNLGLRIDAERQAMDFDSDFSLGLEVAPKAKPEAKRHFDVTSRLVGEGAYQDFFQVLPKLSLSYRPTAGSYLFVAASKSYKTGGYNEQMMTEVLMQQAQHEMMALVMSQGKQQPQVQTGDANLAAFKPEHAYNLELGGRLLTLQDRLFVSATLFGSWIRDLQVARFVTTGTGRTTVNAGKALSLGAEASVKARIWRSLTISAQYGYTHATFQDYLTNRANPKGGAPIEVNYEGNYIPYVPAHTYATMLQLNEPIQTSWLKGVLASVELRGNGPIYWDSENQHRQDPYMTLGARLGVRLPYVTVAIWGRNLTDTRYATFYFQSFGNSFLQQAQPRTFGADLSFHF